MSDQVAAVNHAPLFDPAKYTTAGQPHLLEHLWAKYRAFLQTKLDELTRAGKKAADLDTAVRRAPAEHFLAFAVEYLAKNRPVENFFVDMNHGVVLSDTSRVVVSPGYDLRGTMQQSGAVGVTVGASQPGLDGVVQAGGAIGVI